jgi:hypothetical protein
MARGVVEDPHRGEVKPTPPAVQSDRYRDPKQSPFGIAAHPGAEIEVTVVGDNQRLCPADLVNIEHGVTCTFDPRSDPAPSG